MRVRSAICGALFGVSLASSGAWANGCPDGKSGLGVSRIVEIDATDGPVFGAITKRTRERSFLGPKEVVLTFDDGPMAGLTRSILDTLDRFCTKATFFSVGRMAIAYPETVREILKRGHTLGTHTWSHPMNLPRLKGQQAVDQIESGFAAVAMAAGQPIAPFFRFPGLNDSEALVGHLQKRGIATFTVDVVSNDSYIADTGRLLDRTLGQLQAENGGIALFHDIKPQTARMLPTLLAEMKSRGYRIVHMRAKQPFRSDDRYVDAVRQQMAQKNPAALRTLMAFTETPAAPAPPVLPPEQAVASGPAAVEPQAAAVPAAESPVSRTFAAARSTDQLAAQEQQASPPTVEPPVQIAAVRDPAEGRPILRPVKERKARVAKAKEGASDAAKPVPTPAANPKPAGATLPSTAGNPQKPPVEVIAGSYSAGAARPMAASHPAGGIPPPEVIAGSYGSQRHGASQRPLVVQKSWSETFHEQQRNGGN